jgi:hypothetical protein
VEDKEREGGERQREFDRQTERACMHVYMSEMKSGVW